MKLDEKIEKMNNLSLSLLLQGKIVLVPFKEYELLLLSGNQRDEALDKIEKARLRVSLVQKVLGRFLTTLNKQIPLDAYLESFNNSQEEVRFWMDKSSHIRLSFNTDGSKDS